MKPPLPRLIVVLSLVLTAPAAAQQAGIGPQAGVATIDVLDVGQGDAILIRSPEGKAALVNAGPNGDVFQLLRDRGVDHLDLLAISHHHADHYGGAADVIRAFPPRLLLASTSAHFTPHYLRLLQLVRDRAIRAIAPNDAPRAIEMGLVVLTVLPQPPEDHVEENNNSIALRVHYGAFAALLPGDAQDEERLWWMDRVPELCTNCQVLKLAHHGSRNGIDPRWLDLVKPRLAVASLGHGNEYGHPHPEVIDLLTRTRVPLLRTDRDGSIAIRTDGKRWEVVRSRPTPRGPPGLASGGTSSPTQERDVKARELGRRVNVNTATLQELEALPGIGPVLAGRIVAGRLYSSVEDLDRVAGIGPKRLGKIRSLVTAQ